MSKFPEYDAVVIGAGFAGLYAVQKLTSLGFRVAGFERGEDVGGTWYWNRYPGARCDCESYYYSYGFSAALQQDWTWSRRYAEQPEILAYLGHVTDRFDLRRHFRFGAAVETLVFDEAAELWRVRVQGGHTVTARFVISAMGCLSAVNWPDIPGLRSFQGRLLHTADWPHDRVNFTDRRVGVIGTGASAVQAIPRIAREAAHLSVFQRTANWVLPASNRASDPDFDAWVKANYGEIRERCATSPGAVPFDAPTQSALEMPEAERQAIYQRYWDLGGMRFFTAFNDLFINLEANVTAQAFVRQQILKIVNDPETAKALIPTTHPIGVKRPPLDDDYYETFNRPNVNLVDIRNVPIIEVAGQTVRTADAEYELDDLVVATGFDAITGALLALDVRGRGDVTLQSRWREGPCTYLGLGVAGFPNLFTITGPLSPAVLANMPTAVEQHVDWIADCLDHMRREGIGVIETTEAAEADWVSHADEIVGQTLYPHAESWYFGTNIPGKPRRFGVYLGGFGAYSDRCDAIAQAGYEGFRFTSAPN